MLYFSYSSCPQYITALSNWLAVHEQQLQPCLFLLKDHFCPHFLIPLRLHVPVTSVAFVGIWGGRKFENLESALSLRSNVTSAWSLESAPSITSNGVTIKVSTESAGFIGGGGGREIMDYLVDSIQHNITYVLYVIYTLRQQITLTNTNVSHLKSGNCGYFSFNLSQDVLVFLKTGACSPFGLPLYGKYR